MRDAVVILPWLGEFGWLILQHARYVHWHPAREKIVCCECGHECLFPSATGYYYDWQNPIPEALRWNHTAWGDWGARDRYYGELAPRLQEQFPQHEIIVPAYTCHHHMSDAPGYRFRPRVTTYLPRVDVVLSPRMRAFDTTRNWPHWERLACDLRSSGLTVGIAGRQGTTLEVPADVYAWDHPDGDTAGSIDLLMHCGLYVGVDSGISHLAALCDTPMLVLRSPRQPSTQIGVMQRANKGWIMILGPELWDDYIAIREMVLRALGQAHAYVHYDVAVYAYVDANKEYRTWCEQLFDRIGQYATQSGLRVLTRLRLSNCDEAALEWAHRNRMRAHEIDCVRPGRKNLPPLDRPGEAARTVIVDDSHDVAILAL